MTAIYKGQPVTVLRPATHEDYEFKGGAGEQVLVRLKDGIETIVAVSDITETEAPALSAPPDSALSPPPEKVAAPKKAPAKAKPKAQVKKKK